MNADADVPQQRAPTSVGSTPRATLRAHARRDSRSDTRAGSRQRQALALGAAGDAAGVGNGQHEVQGGEVEAHRKSEHAHGPNLGACPVMPDARIVNRGFAMREGSALRRRVGYLPQRPPNDTVPSTCPWGSSSTPT
jgi:hypothetical protein